MNLNVVILAAGQGKRMFSSRPKVLHPLAGKPMLQHVIETARQLSPTRLCIVYGHGGEQVRAAFADQDLLWAKQDPQLGTGHAVQQALPYLGSDGTSLILYGDVPLIRSQTLRQLLHAAGQGLGLLTMHLNEPDGYGRIVRNAAGEVSSIVEQKDASPEIALLREVNTGMMALPTPLLADSLARLSNTNAQGEYYLTDLVALAAAAAFPVKTVTVEDVTEVLGVNNQSQLARLERVQQTRIAQQLLAAGVYLADPARLDVRGELKCGRDVSIDINCIFEGHIELGPEVSIGPHCVLKNVQIAAGTQIAAFSHIENARIGKNCLIGPYARLRPGSELGEGVHIGNFVEIKNSRIAAQSKANHLTYLGDAHIGERVNIGAGTITCNYDGANKHMTIIEDDVFIGSDSQLIAPVTVRRGATLAAGTTLTKEAPADALTLSRSKQISFMQWKRPKKHTPSSSQ